MTTTSAMHFWDVQTIRSEIDRGSVSAVEVTRYFLDRISDKDSLLRACLYVDHEGALAQASKIDAEKRAGRELGPLAGVPILLKDNLCTRGVPTTCASRILENYVPPFDADAVERLRAAGAVLLGKTNMDEFAMGSSNENSAFGSVKNPWNLEYAPGGSSGGSAASAAAGFAAATLGSDTGGSVRQPASFCGVTAIKPTYGRVSRYGLVAFASSLDQIGPIARTTRDAASVLSVIAGHDRRDATSVTEPSRDYVAFCNTNPKGTRIGVVRETLGDGTSEEVKRAVLTALDVLQKQGCTLVDVSLPHASHSVAVYYLIAPAEASSNLARFDGMRYGLRVRGSDLLATYGLTRAQGFGPEVKRRIMLGTYALSAGYYEAFYLKAQKVRTLIRKDFDEAFKKCDVMAMPTSPTPAFKLGDKLQDPLAMYLADIFTLPPSLAGIPALSTPCGISASGLPMGLQFCAPAFEEGRLIQLADAYERATDWVKLHPPEWV